MYLVLARCTAAGGCSYSSSWRGSDSFALSAPPGGGASAPPHEAADGTSRATRRVGS
jgi:hypothetical protein